jgi:hypothetical protein
MLMMVLLLWMQPNECFFVFISLFSPCMRACGLRGAYSGTIHYIGTIHHTTHHLQDYWVLGQHSGYPFGPLCAPCPGTVAHCTGALFSGLLYLCLFVCLFVCFYCTRGASLPPIYCTSGSGQIYCTKHLWYRWGGVPPLRFGTTGLRATVPCAYCITTRRLLYRSVACYCIR